MRLRLIWIILLLMLSVMLTGCNGARETDEVAYILLIGIDKGKNGNYDVTYQIAVPKALGGEGGGGGDAQPTGLVTVTAPSLAEARNLLKTNQARTVNLSHNKAFIFGEELAREGIGDFLSPMLRFREFRGSMFIVVAHNTTAAEFMKKNKPMLEQLPSKYLETMLLTNDEMGYYLRTSLHEFYARVKSGSGVPYAVLAGVNPKESEGKATGSKDKGERTYEYLAGQLPVKNEGNPINFAGTAVFKGDKMVGTLTTEETRMLAILDGNYPSGFLVVEDPLLPEKGINVNLRLGRSPDIKVRIAEGRPIIEIKLLFEGEITAIPSGINYERQEYRELLEEQISQITTRQMEGMLTKTIAWGADVAGFGYRGRRHFSTYKEWTDYRWDEQYANSRFQLKVTTKLRRSGLMFQTAPLKGSKQ